MFAVKLSPLSLVNLIICSNLLGVIISMENYTESFPNRFTVLTDNGRIRGKLNETLFDKKLYYSFRGIPFGRAPIAELRFKAPVKVEPWTETFDAFEHGNYCIQFSAINNMDVVGDEDCLNLNIFVPAQCLANNNTETLAVMFFLTGGGFRFEYTPWYGPDFFIDQNVIVIVANYRVGPLGFLSLGLPEYSGNMGLKDQLLALEWVNKNIEAFGGDKNRITLMGHSAGSMSASVHILSSKSRKLFRRAILLSGSALSPLLPRLCDHTSIVRNLAEVLYYPVQNEDDLIEFLRQVNVTLLTEYTFQNDYYPGLGRKATLRIWNIIIEKENAINPILSKSPIELTLINRNPNDIDTLFTYTTREFVAIEDYPNPELLKNFDDHFEVQFPLPVSDFRSDGYKGAAEKVRDFYFDGKTIGNETLSNLDQMMSDIRYTYGINLNARVQAAQSSGRTFMSRFSVVSDWSYGARLTKLADGKVLHKNHLDTVYYLFRFSFQPHIFPDSAYSDLTPNSQPYQTIKNMTKFYADFVKYGNPMPHGEPIEFKSKNSIDYNYFDITNESIIVKPNLYKSQMDFWDAIVGLNQKYDKNNFV